MQLRGKRVLITGAAGFIGSHLVEHCCEMGCQVRAFVRYNSANSWGWLDDSACRKDIEVVAGDIRDFDSVSSAVRDCDVVFHLAALIGIPYSYVSPLAYIRTNIEGTYNVLQAGRESDVESLLITSTSETYGTARYVPMDEEHPLQGQSPYSATKIGADQLALSYYRSFETPVKIVRPFNTYGPRQSARAIIPTLIAQMLDGARQLRLGNLEPTRDLTFVKDTVSGFTAIAEAEGLFGEVTNIGSGYEISIGDLATKILQQVGATAEIVTEKQRIRPQNSEVERLFCNATKLREHTTWKPQYTLDRGLTETIAWLRDHRRQYAKADRYTI